MTLRDHAKEVIRKRAERDFEACSPDNNPGRVCNPWQAIEFGLDYERDREAQAAVRTLGKDVAATVYRARWDALGTEWLGSTYPTALVLLRLWDREWSGEALRFANHRLTFLFNLGLDVLEADGIKGYVR